MYVISIANFLILLENKREMVDLSQSLVLFQIYMTTKNLREYANTHRNDDNLNFYKPTRYSLQAIITFCIGNSIYINCITHMIFKECNRPLRAVLKTEIEKK